MIRFDLFGDALILEYEPEFNSADWVTAELEKRGEITLSRSFTFNEDDLLDRVIAVPDDDIGEPRFRFRFGTQEGGYYRIPGRVLDLDSDVLFVAEGMPFQRKLFVAERNISIFRRIEQVKGGADEIVVGGNRDGAIPIEAFADLLAKFPNSGELDRYARARVETIVGEYLDGMQTARENYEAYLSKRKSSVSERPLEQSELIQAEIDKYLYLRENIAEWLENAESYSERDWQRMVVKIILLIFPKYVSVLENVEIADYYTNPAKATKRFIDICLVDAGGNIDVIEIKKPFDNAILARSLYRDNSLPTRELSGSIMQAEKYIFHLSKWGVTGERELTRRYSARLPNDMPIRVTNPKAMILLGRDRLANGDPALTDRQLFDLEVIKRKYANMMDILSYDDLLRRLDNIIASLAKRKADATPPASV